MEVAELSPEGEVLQKIAGYRSPGVRTSPQVLLLPDGRAVVSQDVSGHESLMAVTKGKDAVRLINTPEGTAPPMTLAGAKEIAFLIGPQPRQTIALADIASGRVIRRLSPAKGSIRSLTASLDGATLYFAAGDSIWTIPSFDGAARALGMGHAAVMEPSGTSLLVTRMENSRLAMFHVPLDGGGERRVSVDPAISLDTSHIGVVSSGSLNPQGRLVMTVFLADSWFNPLAVFDTATGRVTRIASDDWVDFDSAVWTPQGRILANRRMPRAALWRFQPDRR
jgi:hypothetical protein